MVLVRRPREDHGGLTEAIHDLFAEGDEESRFLVAEEIRELVNTAHRRKVAAPVWELLQKHYKREGMADGWVGAKNARNMLQKATQFTIDIDKNGIIKAVTVYRPIHGKKRIGSAHDGTDEGKRALKEILKRDLDSAWGEVSGGMERYLTYKGKNKRIPSSRLKELTGKEADEYDEDGYHYTRNIGGKQLTKILMGTPIIRNLPAPNRVPDSPGMRRDQPAKKTPAQDLGMEPELGG